MIEDVQLNFELHAYAEVSEVDIRKILGIQLDGAAGLEMEDGFQCGLSADQIEGQPVAFHVPEIKPVGTKDYAGELQNFAWLRQVHVDEGVVVVTRDRVVEGYGDGAGPVMRAIEADQKRRPPALIKKLVKFALQQIQRDDLPEMSARRMVRTEPPHTDDVERRTDQRRRAVRPDDSS